MSPLYRWVIRWARNVHLYITLFGLALLLLFAVTGFMLNHEDWFATTDPTTREVTGQLPTDVLQEPDLFAVGELLRKNFGATGLADKPDVDPNLIRINYKQVGRSVEVEIRRETGAVTATYISRGLVGVLLDLHRGKSTGFLWSLIIDGVCVLMLLISATGLVMWWTLKGRGRYGLVTLLAGVGLIVGVYVWFMP